MNNLYRKLAFTNVRNNKQFYFPYLLMGMISAMMFYSMRAMQGNEGLNYMSGGMQLKGILTLGTVVIAICVCIFLFYTNSFIMKRRKKELGVYNILGMEKKHIAKVILWEAMFTFVVSVGGGLVFGILFNKLLMMFLYRLTGLTSTIQFYVSGYGCLQTVELFGAIYIATFLYNFMQIQMSNPIELLHGSSTGEREPKTKMIMTILGIVCLGIGYYISIVTENPVEVLLLFFVAVVLVILGTYFLFTAGSIALLKLLRKNKKYYYQTRHFTSVSGMIYRMKQNAVGLANICILSTMVLVMISTTVSMYVGLDDAVDTRYPTELAVNIYDDQIMDLTSINQMSEAIDDCVKGNGRTITKTAQAVSMDLAMKVEENNVAYYDYWDNMDYAQITFVKTMTREAYEKFTGNSLEDFDENQAVVIYSKDFNYDTVVYNDREYQVVGTYGLPDEEETYYSVVGGAMYLVVKDDAALNTALEQAKSMLKDQSDLDSLMSYTYQVDFDGTSEEKIACANAVRELVSTWKDNAALPQTMSSFHSSYIESRQEGYEDFMFSNGGLFFLGLFLGVMFLMVTVLIIYYKQISEGYDDKERYAIMEKVGMSNAEVKAAISSQVRTVFFLPLVTAAIHLAAAFPMLRRLLSLLNLTNTTIFIWCLAGTVVVFGVFYFVVFILTSKSYYKIVGNQV